MLADGRDAAADLEATRRESGLVSATVQPFSVCWLVLPASARLLAMKREGEGREAAENDYGDPGPGRYAQAGHRITHRTPRA